MGKKRQVPTAGSAATAAPATAAGAAAAAARPPVPPEVQAIIDQHDFLSLNEHGKAHCNVTNLDIPARVDALKTHLASKKFIKQRDWYSYDFSKYEPHIVANKKDPKLLFCKLTMKPLNRIPEEIETHVNGKRFKRLVAEAEAAQARKQANKKAAAVEADGDEASCR
ncbi:surfeit locus protein 2-domain-containing protein [Tribonema minus]|uniref:Surfeit locus protein 2-domain-containing protein n=1 Tax=Tribonema minus TaxID=303371 RepID=A0A835YV33_9STRA|nr:surfeit locus protein 2-domain-containing protein [Tribonema minus]